MAVTNLKVLLESCSWPFCEQLKSAHLKRYKIGAYIIFSNRINEFTSVRAMPTR